MHAPLFRAPGHGVVTITRSRFRPAGSHTRPLLPARFKRDQAIDLGVKRIELPDQAFSTHAAAVKRLPAQGVDLEWQTSDLPTTHRFIAASYQLLVSSLPLAAIEELQRFAYDPSAPSALLITGLPTATDMPDTPNSRKGIGPEKDVNARLPVAESIVLGAAKLLGDPMMAASIAKGNRGGLVTDLVGVNLVTYTHKVPMKPHVEFGIVGKRPDFVLFLGVRQDPANACHTLLCDNRALLAALDAEDIALLREHPMHLILPGGATAASWTAIEGTDEDPIITLFDNVIVPKMQVASSDERATAAYQRAMAKAVVVAEHVAVQPGELLIVNQWRCNKGRSAYALTGAGDDWWLLKTYSAIGLWQSKSVAPLQWPQVVVPGI